MVGIEEQRPKPFQHVSLRQPSGSMQEPLSVPRTRFKSQFSMSASVDQPFGSMPPPESLPATSDRSQLSIEAISAAVRVDAETFGGADDLQQNSKEHVCLR